MGYATEEDAQFLTLAILAGGSYTYEKLKEAYDSHFHWGERLAFTSSARIAPYMLEMLRKDHFVIKKDKRYLASPRFFREKRSDLVIYMKELFQKGLVLKKSDSEDYWTRKICLLHGIRICRGLLLSSLTNEKVYRKS